jgi:hypothetical protein
MQLVLFGMPNRTFQTLVGMHSSTCCFRSAFWNHRLGCAVEARQACIIGHFISYLGGHDMGPCVTLIITDMDRIHLVHLACTIGHSGPICQLAGVPCHTKLC